MKLSCTQVALEQGLNIVRPAVADKPIVPTLNDVLMEADSDGLRLTGSNLQQTLICRIEAQVEEQGIVAMPFLYLSELVPTLPKGDVALSITEGRRLYIEVPRSRSHLAGHDPGDYPPVPKVEGESVNLGPIQDYIGQVLYAVEKDNLGRYGRPGLGGVRFIFDSNVLRLVATDGHQLATTQLTLPEPVAEPFALTVPYDAARMLANLEGVAEMAATGSLARFQAGDTALITRLVEASFPLYEKLIPTGNFMAEVTANVAELTRAVKIAGQMGGRPWTCTLTWGPGVLQVDGAVQDQYVSIGVNATVKGAGKSNFDSRLLLNALGAVAEEEAKLQFPPQNGPAVVRPVGESPQLALLMPLAELAR